MPQDRTRKIVITGVLGAITIFLGITRWGFITISFLPSLTILHIPVIIGAVLEGPVVGLAIGLIFGLFSMIQAIIAPGPSDVIFVNPLISILPRLFIGPVAYLVWKALQKWQVVGLIASGLAGSLTNAILVLGMIGVLGLAPWALVFATFISNSLVEAAVSAFLVTVVVAAVLQINVRRKQGANL